MKKIILLFTLFLFTINTYSQEKGYVGLGLGFATVGGDIDGLDNGLALNLIGLGFMFSDSVGATLNWGASSHKSNSNALVSDVDYGIGYLGIGPLFRFKSGENMTIDLKPQYMSQSISVEAAGVTVTESGSGILLGSSLNFNRQKKWGFGLDLDYGMGKIDGVKVNVFSMRAGVQYRW